MVYNFFQEASKINEKRVIRRIKNEQKCFMTNLKTFIAKTTIVFKTFDFNVKMTKNNAAIWNFATSNPEGDKKYVVFCSPELEKAKGIIKIALKKLPSSHRLVVVCSNFKNEDYQESLIHDYCLITFDKLNEYGVEMLDVLEKEEKSPINRLKLTSSVN